MGGADQRVTGKGPAGSNAGKTSRKKKKRIKGVVDAAQQALLVNAPGIAESVTSRRERRAAKKAAEEAKKAEIRDKEKRDAAERAKRLALARKKAKEDEKIRQRRELLEQQRKEKELKTRMERKLRKEFEKKAAAKKAAAVANRINSLRAQWSFLKAQKPEEAARIEAQKEAQEEAARIEAQKKAQEEVQKIPGLTSEGWNPDAYHQANPVAKGGGYAQGGAVHSTDPAGKVVRVYEDSYTWRTINNSETPGTEDSTPHYNPHPAGAAIGSVHPAYPTHSTYDPKPEKHNLTSSWSGRKLVGAGTLSTGEAAHPTPASQGRRHKSRIESPWVAIKVGAIAAGDLPTGKEATEARSKAIGNSAEKPKIPGYLPTPSSAREGYEQPYVSWANRPLGGEEQARHSQPPTAMEISGETDTYDNMDFSTGAGPAMSFSYEASLAEGRAPTYQPLPPELDEVKAATLLTGMRHSASSAFDEQPSTKPQPGPAEQTWKTPKGKGPAQNR